MITTALLLVSIYVSPKVEEYCTVQHEYAETVMIARSIPIPVNKLLDIAKDVPNNQAIVLYAYKKPQKTDPVEFANEIYKMCIRGVHESN